MKRHALSFPFLSDPDLTVIDLYGLRHRGAYQGNDTAIPAMILVDRDGIIRFKHVAHAVQDRADPRVVEAEIGKLAAS